MTARKTATPRKKAELEPIRRLDENRPWHVRAWELDGRTEDDRFALLAMKRGAESVLEEFTTHAEEEKPGPADRTGVWWRTYGFDQRLVAAYLEGLPR